MSGSGRPGGAGTGAAGGVGAEGQRRPPASGRPPARPGPAGDPDGPRAAARERVRRSVLGGGLERLGAMGGPSATAARTPFVVLVVALLAGGLISLLLLNSAVNQDSFQLNKLEKDTTGYTDEQQQLQQEVDGYSAPGELERRARELGMVPGDNPAFLDPDGSVHGDPGRATAPPETAPPTSAPPSSTPTAGGPPVNPATAIPTSQIPTSQTPTSQTPTSTP